MPYNRNYPSTVAEILDDSMTFKPAALRALRAFRASRPWQGTLDERKAKFRTLNRALAAAYALPTPRLHFHSIGRTEPGNGWCRPSYRGPCDIGLVGTLSVITYLHEFGHARGYDERRACRWSVNVFRRIFPRSFSRLNQVGHTLRRGV